MKAESRQKFGGLHMNQSNTDMCAQVSKLPCFDFVPAAVYHILLRYIVTILLYMDHIIWWHNAWYLTSGLHDNDHVYDSGVGFDSSHLSEV